MDVEYEEDWICDSCGRDIPEVGRYYWQFCHKFCGGDCYDNYYGRTPPHEPTKENI